MSLVKEFENLGPQRGWNDHTFPEQDTSSFNREGLSASVEAFEVRPACWRSVLRSGQRDLMNLFTVCSNASTAVLKRSLLKVQEVAGQHVHVEFGLESCDNYFFRCGVS
jgi:hypothetical protein